MVLILASPLAMATILNQPWHSLTDGWKENGLGHTVEYYAAIKRKESIPSAGKVTDIVMSH